MSNIFVSYKMMNMHCSNEEEITETKKKMEMELRVTCCILWSSASHGGAEAAVELEHGELVQQLLGLLQVLRRRFQGVVRHHHLVGRRVDLCPLHMLLLAAFFLGKFNQFIVRDAGSSSSSEMESSEN
uniref:Uncharacterized protein n=1 Tax=Oryza brachyantha TaxID=4533 RepID=J3L8Z7_ORYBR